MSEWKQQWDVLQETLLKLGATGRWAQGRDKPPRFDVAPPATEQEIRNVESALGGRIPASMRRVLRGFSSRVCIEWALPDCANPPAMFRGIWAGECRWDLESLPALQETHRKWIDLCFTGKYDYDLVWHHKFAFIELGNFDMLGIDTSSAGMQAVVYLSREDGRCHGYRLGNDFEDYIDRLTALAFVGAEDCQLTPFLPDAVLGLQTKDGNAAAWRHWLGLTPKSA